MKIKTQDTVVVIAGKDKGRTGKVIEVLPKKGLVLVEGVNIYQRHRKKTYDRPGGVVEVTKPVNVSNVALLDPKSKKASRVGYSVNKKGEKQRIARKSGTQLD